MDFEGNPKRRKTHNPLPSAAANSSSAAGGEYEVFLSFRGGDTRNGFTDFLYTYLDDVGIRTFRDDNELRPGEKIGSDLLKAIEKSKISIPIFSENYASSRWCLRELAHMVECHRRGQKILPIFYDVEPSDVRHQTGCYEKAFLRHEKDFDEKTVQGWKEALREVGELKGWELDKETNGREGELVKMVASNVLLELKKNHMVLNDTLVGIHHHVEEMKKLLNVGSSDVSIVVIHGMGGIGKTTIAKVIYNQLLQCFECCCFLPDVRETSLRKGLVDLQNQLISKLRKGKCSNSNIVDVEEGITTIKDIVCRKKVLFILDDVDQKSQFDKLAGMRDCFGSGSRIIVTTRNKGVLDPLKVDKTYEPPMMEPRHSLELFCRHAFRSFSPPKDYDILSDEIVSTAAGLPLALEVIGSLLLDKGEDEWKELLAKLKKIPEEKVQEKLMISYEALNDQQKEIFLDIACLFNGEDKKYPFDMWDACEFCPRNGINVLVLRSLVKIQDDDKFWMHDQLRDLGREIVRKENRKDPRERSRLWRDEEVSYILESRMGTKKVEVLRISFDVEPETPIFPYWLMAFFAVFTKEGKLSFLTNTRLFFIFYFIFCFPIFFFLDSCHFFIQKKYRVVHRSLTNEEFGQLLKLRYLRVCGAGLTGDFKHLLSELRWLEWDGGGCNILHRNFVNFTPTSFHLENLVVLRLSCCVIKDDTWSEMKMLQKLKVLYLSDVYGFRRLPYLPINLRELSILSCTSITELPDSIGNLEKLEWIHIFNCHSLKGEIPWSIGRLSSLRILMLYDTGICSLPTSVCGLSRLQTLRLSCDEPESLPELPHSLTDLQVSSGLTTTFLSLSDLVNLRKLYFSLRNNPIEIPRDIG